MAHRAKLVGRETPEELAEVLEDIAAIAVRWRHWLRPNMRNAQADEAIAKSADRLAGDLVEIAERLRTPVCTMGDG
jgi:hypothetical protein